MIEGQVDLDPLCRTTDLELDATGTADAARRSDDTGERCTLRYQLDIVRPEEQLCVPRRRVVCTKSYGAAADPHLAVVDLDRHGARLADKAEHERIERLIIDGVWRANLLD